MAHTPSRRVRRRPSMTDGGMSGSSPSNSVSSSYVEVGVNSAEREIDIPDLDDVRESRTQTAPQNFDPLSPPQDGDAPNRSMTPSEILMQRAEGGRSTASQIRLRRVMVARMMLRGIDRVKMAQTLTVSEATVDKDIRAVKEQLIKAADTLDIKEQVGISMLFYSDIKHQALRMATADGNSNAVKIAALKTALSAQADMARFFKLSGVFDVLPFIVTNKQEKSDIEKLTDLTRAVLALGNEDDTEMDSSYETSLNEYMAEREKQLNDTDTDLDDDLDLI